MKSAPSPAPTAPSLLKRLLFRSGVIPQLRHEWRDDQRKADEKLEERVTARIESLNLAERLEVLEREAQRLRATLASNAQHRERRYGRDTFDEERVSAHVSHAIASTPVDTDPTAHLLITNLMPSDTYDALLDAIPPRVFFSQKDTTKQDFKLGQVDFAPEWTMTGLGFMEDRLIPQMIVPALLRKFDPHIRATYSTTYGAELGRRVADLPHVASAGRLMLRRRGYHLDPHLDPRRVVVTCLIYFARPGDSEAFGTMFYRISGNPVIDQRSTFYPESQGCRCDLVKTAPFRPNTAVAFLNAGAAHGADIPRTAPEDTARYAYQFYLSPEPSALGALLGETGED